MGEVQRLEREGSILVISTEDFAITTGSEREGKMVILERR